jgi:hypothetical protein
VYRVTGLSDKTVSYYLGVEYKQAQRTEYNEPKIAASERVENVLGKKVVELKNVRNGVCGL